MTARRYRWTRPQHGCSDADTGTRDIVRVVRTGAGLWEPQAYYADATTWWQGGRTFDLQTARTWAESPAREMSDAEVAQRMAEHDARPLRECPRCRRPTRGWLLKRADVCAPTDWVHCIREPRPEWPRVIGSAATD